MKTDELITALARAVEPVPAGVALRRLGGAIGGGALLALPLAVLWLGINPALGVAALLPMFWVKFAFVAAIVLAGFAVARRLALPAAPLAASARRLALPFAAMWLLAAIVLLTATPEARTALLMGRTWRACPFNIAMLSLPALVLSLWAMRSLAPTRLRLAGAGAGLLAGATGAFVYLLHCPELAAPFLGLWYVLGMLIPTAAGAALGPRVLRW